MSLYFCLALEPRCLITYQTARGSIFSPDLDFDGFYDPMIECVYRIWAELDHQVELQFLDIDIEDDDNCLKDYIKVRVENCKTTIYEPRHVISNNVAL